MKNKLHFKLKLFLLNFVFFIDFEKTVLQEISTIKNDQRTIMKKLDCILNSIKVRETSEKPNHNVIKGMKKLIPVNNFTDLERLEDKLKDEIFFNQMVSNIYKYNLHLILIFR